MTVSPLLADLAVAVARRPVLVESTATARHESAPAGTPVPPLASTTPPVWAPLDGGSTGPDGPRTSTARLFLTTNTAEPGSDPGPTANPKEHNLP